MLKANKKSYRLLRFILTMIFAAAALINVTYGLQNARDVKNEFIGTTEPTTPRPTPEPTTPEPTTPTPTTTTTTEETPATESPTTTEEPTIESTTEPTIEPPVTTESPTEPPTTTQPATEQSTTATQPTTTISSAETQPATEPINPTEPIIETTEDPGNGRIDLENGWTAEYDEDEDVWYIYDENENPLGTIKLPPGEDIKDYDIPGNLTPFPKPPTTEETPAETHKPNPPTGIGNPPKTGDEDTDPGLWLMIMAVVAFILRYILFYDKK